MTELIKEYAQAIFLIACEENKQKEYAKDLDTVLEVFGESEEFMELVSSPAISLTERLAVLEHTFSPLVCEHIVSFLQLLCEKKRIRGLEECISEYHALVKASENISLVKVTSAVQLSEEQKQSLISKLEKLYGRAVTLLCNTDSTLIGGMVIESDGKVIDASLRRRLRDVKEVISK